MSHCNMCHAEFAENQLQHLNRGQQSLHAMARALTYVPMIVVGFLGGQMDFGPAVSNTGGTQPALYCQSCIDWMPTRLLLSILFLAVFCAAAYRATVWIHGLFAL